MKTVKKILTKTITKRIIKIKPIGNTNFCFIKDIRKVKINGKTFVKTFYTVNTIRAAKKIKGKKALDNVIRVHTSLMPSMPVQIFEIVRISKKDLQRAKEGKCFIDQVVDYKTTLIPTNIPDDYTLILWDDDTNLIMDLYWNFIPLPFKFNKFNGKIDNYSFDLDKLLAKLQQDKHVYKPESLCIIEDPFIRTEDGGYYKYIEFDYHLSKEEYNFEFIGGFDIYADRYDFILDNFIKAQDCRLS